VTGQLESGPSETGPFEMLGDDDAPVCEDGVCAIPELPKS